MSSSGFNEVYGSCLRTFSGCYLYPSLCRRHLEWEKRVSLLNGNILISHPETRFPRYMTDSQSNVVWIGTVKGPFIFGCVCLLFSPSISSFFLFFVWVRAVFVTGTSNISSEIWSVSVTPQTLTCQTKMAILTSKSILLARKLLK